jgi:hypothetical protein
LTAGAHHADRAHEEAEPALLGGEDALDQRTHPGAGGIAAGDVRPTFDQFHPLTAFI